MLPTTLIHSEAWGVKSPAVKNCWCKSEACNSLFIEWLVLLFLSPLAKVQLSPSFETKHISWCYLLGSPGTLSFAMALCLCVLGQVGCEGASGTLQGIQTQPSGCGCEDPLLCTSHRATLSRACQQHNSSLQNFSVLGFTPFFLCECIQVNKRITTFKNTIYPMKTFQHVNYGALNSR